MDIAFCSIDSFLHSARVDHSISLDEQGDGRHRVIVVGSLVQLEHGLLQSVEESIFLVTRDLLCQALLSLFDDLDGSIANDLGCLGDISSKLFSRWRWSTIRTRFFQGLLLRVGWLQLLSCFFRNPGQGESSILEHLASDGVQVG